MSFLKKGNGKVVLNKNRNRTIDHDNKYKQRLANSALAKVAGWCFQIKIKC